jgi:multidrug efflux pump subunit AcrA (membrane-fusion protein)
MKAPAGITVLPGMTAIVTFAHRLPGSQGKGILVPVSAIAKQDSGEQVAWVIGSDGLVSCRPVKMGAATDGQIEIVDGLRPGDHVVVAGVAFLREGMKVRDLGNALGGDRP